MGKRKLWGVMLIITALVIMQLPVSEADAATSASDFQITGSTLKRYVGTESNVTIPSTVTVIGKSAFEENDYVRSVVIPQSVTKIEEYAFWGCDNLNAVTLGKGLTEVGDYAFADCKGLKEMTIPANIRRIGIYAFEDCVNMTDITIPPQVIDIHESAFDGCYKLVIHAEEGTYADRYASDFARKQAEMPEYEDVPSYTETTDTVIILPDTDPGTVDSTVPGEVTGAVSDNEVSLDEGNVLGSTRIVGNRAVVFIDNTSPTVLNATPFLNTSNAEGTTAEVSQNLWGGFPKYTIVDGKVVADQAYYRSTSVSDVQLPAGIEEIGQFAFARSSITGIVIPEGTRTISYGAFYHCDQLGSVDLPASIENVEPKAFAYTAMMNQFDENGGEFLICGHVLLGYGGEGTQVILPDGVRVIAAEAFAGKNNLQQVILPDSLEVIGEGAFENCSALTFVTFGQNIRKIKDRAFAGCALEEEVLPDSLSEVGLGAFEDNVVLHYSGSAPQITHETSAERLSNEQYRKMNAESEQIGVEVEGMEQVYAQLSGAARAYRLTIIPSQDTKTTALFRSAFERAVGGGIPANNSIYSLTFSDSSQIPLTKLGKQLLTILLPVEERLQSENLKAAILDRNGQLEAVSTERLLLDGRDYIRFSVDHIQDLIVYGDGTDFNNDAIVEENVTFQSFSEGPGPVNGQAKSRLSGWIPVIKWTLSGSLLMLGCVMILYKKRKN